MNKNFNNPVGSSGQPNANFNQPLPDEPTTPSSSTERVAKNSFPEDSDSFDFPPLDNEINHITLPSHAPSKELEEAIKNCGEAERRSKGNPNLIVRELADLKRQIDLHDEKIKNQNTFIKISAYFSRLFGLSDIGYADALYSRNKHLLNETQKTNLLNLEESYKNKGFAASLKVTDLILPEGKYSGHVENGQPHGEGTLKVSEDYICEGTFKEGKLMTGTVTYRNGMVEVLHLKTKYGDYSGPVDKENRSHGKGILLTKDGSIHEVSFDHGKLIESSRQDSLENKEEI